MDKIGNCILESETGRAGSGGDPYLRPHAPAFGVALAEG
jgi:hypothetical protein